MLDATFAQGVAGLAADVAGYTLRPWGFDALIDRWARVLSHLAPHAKR